MRRLVCLLLFTVGAAFGQGPRPPVSFLSLLNGDVSINSAADQQSFVFNGVQNKWNNTTRLGLPLTAHQYVVSGSDGGNNHSIFTSNDGVNWALAKLNAYTDTNNGGSRDADIFPFANKWWMVYTVGNFTGGGTTWTSGVPSYFGLASSPDGINNWTFVQYIQGLSTSVVTWAPSHFIDQDGTLHVIVGCTTTPGVAGTGMQPYEVHPSLQYNLGGTWSTATNFYTNGSGKKIDSHMIRINNLYYCFYNDGGGLRQGFASTITAGTFTEVLTQCNGSQCLGQSPSVFPLDNDRWGLIENDLSSGLMKQAQATSTANLVAGTFGTLTALPSPLLTQASARGAWPINYQVGYDRTNQVITANNNTLTGNNTFSGSNVFSGTTTLGAVTGPVTETGTVTINDTLGSTGSLIVNNSSAVEGSASGLREYVVTDPNDGSHNALFIAPSTGSKRLYIGNGTQTVSRFNLGNIVDWVENAPPYSQTGRTFSQLGTISGMFTYMTDGKATNCGDATCTTFGTTVTGGGGSLHLLVWYNGTNFTLVGK